MSIKFKGPMVAIQLDPIRVSFSPPKQLTAWIAGLALIGWSGINSAAFAASPPHPNVLFILADDLGYMDVGANNTNTFYETPNINSLAKGGMRFTSGYAACPVCSPTRASILTGKYPPRTGITDYIGGPQPGPRYRKNTKLLPAPYQEYLALSETTLAKAFKAQGYVTFFAGKWHLGPEGYWPEQQGFDVNVAGCGWGHPKTYFSPYGNPKLTDGPVGENLPHRLASETVKFIEANRDKPFLAYLSFYSVHTPLEARDDLVKKYEAKAINVKPSGPEFGWEGKSKVRLVQSHPVYAGMIEAMDSGIGEVLAAVDRLGLASNTIVIFTSDNGGLSTAEGQPTSNLPLRAGKGWLYEGGIREPWIFRVPGVTKPGSVCDTPVITTDFFPTLLALAGFPLLPEQHVDGVSLKPLIEGGTLRHGPLFWHYPHYGNQGGAPGGAVRDGDWKLIEWYEDGRLELFNLHDDIGEKNNLAAANPQKAKELHEKLAQWRKDVAAKMPAPNPNFGRTAMLEPELMPAVPVEE